MKDKIIVEIFKEVARESTEDLEITPGEVEAIFDSQWKFIHSTIVNLPLKDVTEENFKNLKTNFNIPALGKLFTNFRKINNVRERYKANKKRWANTKDDVQ